MLLSPGVRSNATRASARSKTCPPPGAQLTEPASLDLEQLLTAGLDYEVEGDDLLTSHGHPPAASATETNRPPGQYGGRSREEIATDEDEIDGIDGQPRRRVVV